MRRLLSLIASVSAVALVAAPALQAQARAGSGPGPGSTQVPPGPVHAYVNPFADPAWTPSRTDMGMDWVSARKLPVRAIGDAVILGSDSHSGWPGHHTIWYQLLDGSHAGDIIYVAEHLQHLLPVGRTVKAGQQIAVALPGYPWTEWGWADAYGSPRAYPCYHEGQRTNSGKEMERFLMSLGAAGGDPVKRGPDRPAGKLC
jgi:hypothetical protein